MMSCTDILLICWKFQFKKIHRYNNLIVNVLLCHHKSQVSFQRSNNETKSLHTVNFFISFSAEEHLLKKINKIKKRT